MKHYCRVILCLCALLGIATPGCRTSVHKESAFGVAGETGYGSSTGVSGDGHGVPTPGTSDSLPSVSTSDQGALAGKALAAPAENGEPEAEPREEEKPVWPNSHHLISFYLENDKFAGSDRYYTNGVKLTWLSPDIESANLPGWARIAGRPIPPYDMDGYTNNISLAVGHSIYTPANTRTSHEIKDDRPYAGWLYGHAALHHKNTVNLHTLGLTMGIVGPSAQGELVQNGVHTLIHAEEANGWDHQLHDELGAILNYEYKRRMAAGVDDGGLGADLIPHLRVSGGNVLTEGAIGASVRLGYNVPLDFHGNRISTVGYAVPPKEGWSQGPRGPFAFYIFGGVEGLYVAHNIFLDGNTFEDSNSVDREPWVSEMELGAGIGWKKVRLIYTHVWRTREFREQRHGQYHNFGALNLAMEF